MQKFFNLLFYDEENLYPKYYLGTMKYILIKEEIQINKMDLEELKLQFKRDSNFGLSHDDVHISHDFHIDPNSISSKSSFDQNHNLGNESK
jgi:hypothetical protein